jgi:hypothetical protein
MTTRRQFLSRGTLALLGATGTAFALPSETRDSVPDGTASKGMITLEAEKAISRGLAYLASLTRQPNGAYFGTNAYSGNTAVTSLAGLAFMAAGHHPGRGAYGPIVTRALEDVLGHGERSPGRDFLHNANGTPHGPMYGHGFATLFLAEVSGMVPLGRLRDRVQQMLRKAVDLIVRSQNGEGGWRYYRDSIDADISVTICQIMALRAARNAGVYVQKSTVDRCVQYVKLCQDRKQGFFRYQKQGGNDQQAFARTAAGVCALFAAGIYEGPEITLGLEYLKRNRNTPQNGWNDMHYFYGHYYAAQAMWTAGGSYWQEWFPWIRDQLVERQRELGNGAWRDGICIHYGTAMACIILQIPNNYLPIMQK